MVETPELCSFVQPLRQRSEDGFVRVLDGEVRLGETWCESEMPALPTPPTARCRPVPASTLDPNQRAVGSAWLWLEGDHKNDEKNDERNDTVMIR